MTSGDTLNLTCIMCLLYILDYEGVCIYVGEYDCMYIDILSLLFIPVFVIIYNFCTVPIGPISK